MEPLTSAYARCRELHRVHGRTYYLATKLLPAWKRPHVHALYGFTRYADDIVDTTADLAPAERAAQLAAWSAKFLSGLAGAPVDDPLLPAVLNTVTVFDIDRNDFDAFLRSMTMDLTVTDYATYDDLLSYMDGSAAVIGTMMLPILGSSDPVAARGPARELGLAFQLTNFIRDVGEDLERGRVYLPLADLDRFGLTKADLAAAAANRHATAPIRELIAFEVQRARRHYADAAPGIPMLERSSQACIRAAYCVYGAILTEIEQQNYDVFARRAVVPKRKRLLTAARCFATRPGRPVSVPGRPADPGRTPIAAAFAALL
ncbi:phytoene/squalene synthase family protein [Virgisporangium aurantiacum]|uniref:Phytoene synthase n=1 Tax=Virgisporangium aurantiacum TaxID=175570 RepID=A0A8J4E8N4_9ACTN|nr:phytoene/squalene synthase family protein [Virgisporangium aurantiacum]GIJ62952.1 phytoene synthase [Virgisporangium aurantiacum]